MSVRQWDDYMAKLAPLALWTPPDSVQGRDVIERVRRDNSGGAVAAQALMLTRNAWRSFPEEIRGQALSMLNDMLDDIIGDTFDNLENIDAFPIIGELIAAVVVFISGLVDVGRAVSDSNRQISNQAHQRAQARTFMSLSHPGDWIYSRAVCQVYVQFVKRRPGGNFDVKPAFSRPGLKRDYPFLGLPSAPDSGNCQKEWRQGPSSWTWDPPSSCRRVLGLSSLFYPWWSGAYPPGPLPVWDAEYTYNSNVLVSAQQNRLIGDAVTNLQCPLETVERVRDRLLGWYRTDQPMYPINGAGNVAGPKGARIDATKDPDHISSSQARAWWYVGDDGTIRTYDGQAGAALSDWGVPAIAGDPSNLGITLSQRNTVVSMCAAFAARRQATLRDGRRVAGILRDHPLSAFDPDARQALQYAGTQLRMLPMLGDSTASTRRISKRPPPKRGGPKGQQFAAPTEAPTGPGGTASPKAAADDADGTAVLAALAGLLFI